MGETPFQMTWHDPPAPLRGVVVGLATYAERGVPIAMRHAVPLKVPVIVSLGTPFRIGLGREPSPADGRPSFAAGLWAGPVHIASDGGAACVQADLHPVQAFRVFGGAIAEIAGAMVPLDEVFGAAGRRLVERAGDAADDARATAVARFIADRLGPPASAATRFAWDALARSGGRRRVTTIATEFGISRTLLSTRFRAEVGIAPKTVARMMRYLGACRLAAGGTAAWADVAAAAGYADQAHLVREFAEFAGETPTAWARRLALSPWLADAEAA